MFSRLKINRVAYILSNLFVLPAIVIPYIDFFSNVSFLITVFLLVKTNLFLLLFVSFIFIIKNNSNYRFNLLIRHKGLEVSKSDYECVYVYAWCTLLRYILIGIAVNEVVKFFK